MPRLKGEDRVFAKSFRYAQQGHAVWPRVLTDTLAPGTCGYINGNGDWTTIAQLTDKESIVKADLPNLPSLDGVSQSNVGGSSQWGPKLTEKVIGKIISLSAGAMPPEAPVGVRAGVEYTCETHQGAALLTKGIVTNSVLHGDVAAKAWVEKNIDALVSKDAASMSRNGLWLVTKTHHAVDVAKTVFQSKGSKASFHVGAEVLDTAEAKASAAWWSAEHLSAGWDKQSAQDPNENVASSMANTASDVWSSLRGTAAPPPPPLGVVVFFGGIWWKPGKFLSRKMRAVEIKEQQKYLSHDDDATPASVAELPGVAPEEEERAFQEFRASAVGIDEKAEELRLQRDNYDSFEVYAEVDSDSDSD